MDLGRLAGMKGIKLKGKLTLEIDQDVCAGDLGRLLSSSKSGEDHHYPDEEYDVPMQGHDNSTSSLSSMRQHAELRKAPWLSQNQKPSHPHFYPISAGLMSYRE